MAKDWRSGTLLGAGYAFIGGGRALILDANRATLEGQVRTAAERSGLSPDLAVKHIKQVCIILPPWEDAALQPPREEEQR